MKEQSTNFAPVSQKQRIVALDVIRGIAVLGILIINIAWFGILSENSARWEALNLKAGGIDFWLVKTMTVLFEGKMRALFCILFGAGIMLFIEQKKAASGKSPWKLFYRRMAWLVLFGLINAHVLLWRGDILYFYGIFGMVVFLFRNMKPIYKSLGIVVVILFTVVTGQLYYSNIRSNYLTYLDVKKKMDAGTAITSSDSTAIREWEEFRSFNIPNQEEVQKKIETMHGSYADVAGLVRPEVFKYETKYLVFTLGDNVALMLLGMALLQWGFFHGRWRRKHYVYTMVIGIGIGLPIVIINEWFNFTYRATLEQFFAYFETHSVSWDTLLYQIQRIFLSLGYASLFMLLIKEGSKGWLKNTLKATGQMAFTNYILQSVICTLFFFGYGLDYFEKFCIWQLFLFVLGVWLIEMSLSVIWLRFFKFGPLEWLWRSLTYWKIMPMRRQ